MKKLLMGALLLTLISAGCAITDYPVITDARGDYSGVIRTGHKAYIRPSAGVATIWSDGSDELFTLVYQNQYGDQKLYTFNNFDPTGSVMFLDDLYCDWRYDGCEITRSWNPVNSVMDNIFDYEKFPDCSGARSLSVFVSYGARYMGECGDSMSNNKQALAAEFANLATTTWRGQTAYIIPIDSSNTTISLNGTNMPLFGSFTAVMNDRFQLMFPMTPNMRQELRWMQDYLNTNSATVDITVGYNSLVGTYRAALGKDAIAYNLNRF